MPMARSPTQDLQQQLAALGAGGQVTQPTLGQVLGKLAPSFFINCTIWYVIYSTLGNFTEEGKPVFDMKASPRSGMPENCLKEYESLHLYMLGQIAYFFGMVLLQILVVYKPFKGVGVCIVGFLELGLNFFILYVVIKGMNLVLFQDKSDQYMQCEHLHNVAWWFFAGIPLITLPAVFCMVCALMVVMMKASAREKTSDGTVVTPAVNNVDYDVAYEQLPAAV